MEKFDKYWIDQSGASETIRSRVKMCNNLRGVVARPGRPYVGKQNGGRRATCDAPRTDEGRTNVFIYNKEIIWQPGQALIHCHPGADLTVVGRLLPCRKERDAPACRRNCVGRYGCYGGKLVTCVKTCK